MGDLRRATDGHMQNGHDCESEFESTTESGRQRWRAAWPAIGAAAAAQAQSAVCRSTTPASAAGAESTAGFDAGASSRGQPTTAAAQAQSNARTGDERSASVARRRAAVSSTTRSGPQPVGGNALAATSQSDPPTGVEHASAFARAIRDPARALDPAGSGAPGHTARVRGAHCGADHSPTRAGKPLHGARKPDRRFQRCNSC